MNEPRKGAMKCHVALIMSDIAIDFFMAEMITLL